MSDFSWTIRELFWYDYEWKGFWLHCSTATPLCEVFSPHATKSKQCWWVLATYPPMVHTHPSPHIRSPDLAFNCLDSHMNDSFMSDACSNDSHMSDSYITFRHSQTFCHSQISDSGMSEGPPIERWRKTCVAISSRLQEIFRPRYKKWPSDRNRNIYQEFLLPPASSSETTTKLLWI